MLKITTKVNENLLIIEAEGVFSDDDIWLGLRLIGTKLPKLREGFTVINDISKMQPISKQAEFKMKAAQRLLINNGSGKIIRIVGEAVSKYQFDKNSEELGYEPVLVSSMDEALMEAELLYSVCEA